MNQNPYDPPGTFESAPGRNKALTLAGIGALLASGYWALVTLLIMGTGNMKAGSVLQVILPLYLIYVYAQRGYQMIFKGDFASAKRIIPLHAVGGVVAIIQIVSGNPFVVALNAVKVLIHIFGGFTAWRAQKDA